MSACSILHSPGSIELETTHYPSRAPTAPRCRLEGRTRRLAAAIITNRIEGGFYDVRVCMFCQVRWLVLRKYAKWGMRRAWPGCDHGRRWKDNPSESKWIGKEDERVSRGQ
jgi:hypothetical protein